MALYKSTVNAAATIAQVQIFFSRKYRHTVAFSHVSLRGRRSTFSDNGQVVVH